MYYYNIFHLYLFIYVVTRKFKITWVIYIYTGQHLHRKIINSTVFIINI